uniref:Uncharacterized protein n=1 Tax=Strongyloides venezuelensis TaxID=75913 RepID=A0A0K0FTG6_STRVS
MSNKNVKRFGRLVSPSSFKEYADDSKSDSNHSLSSSAGDNVLSDYSESSGESSRKKRRSYSREASRKREKSKSSGRRPRKQNKENLTTNLPNIEETIPLAGGITDVEMVDIEEPVGNGNKILNIFNTLNNRIQKIEEDIQEMKEIMQKQNNEIMEMLIGINLVIQEMNERKRPESGQLIRKKVYHVLDEKHSILYYLEDTYIENLVLQAHNKYYGENGSRRIENRELQKFLNDSGIIKDAIGYINDVGKFCKFVADILIPQEYLLKFYFPTKQTRRPKEKLFDKQVVDTFNIAAKYLGAGIIKEEKKFLSRGVHLINARTYDKSKRNRNVAFYDRKNILIPQEYLLKFYFPTKQTRRPKEKLFDKQVVDTFNIAAKYLGAGIIKEEKKFLSRGVHLINARTYDKSKRNRNVAFYDRKNPMSGAVVDSCKPTSRWLRMGKICLSGYNLAARRR